MTDQAWVVLGVVAAAGLLWITKYAITAIATQVVAQIGDSLQIRWQDDIQQAVGPIHEEVTAIRGEVTVNSGKSLKDRVIQLQQQVEALITDG